MKVIFCSSRSISGTKAAGRIVVVINLFLLTLHSVKITLLDNVTFVRLLKRYKESERKWCLRLTTSTSSSIVTKVAPIAILGYTQVTSQTNITMSIYLYYCTPLLNLRHVTRYSGLFLFLFSLVIFTFFGLRSKS
jgi:Na+/melibiose symporter-like transporter